MPAGLTRPGEGERSFADAMIAEREKGRAAMGKESKNETPLLHHLRRSQEPGQGQAMHRLPR